MKMLGIGWLPEDDGATHINVYSKAKTALGRWLSNWTKQTMLTQDGLFESIEGYWYWLGSEDERLRLLSGWQAKALGRTLKKQFNRPDFAQRIEAAMILKLDGNDEMRQRFLSSRLPFAHYYVYNGQSVPAGAQWVIEAWERLRSQNRGD